MFISIASSFFEKFTNIGEWNFVMILLFLGSLFGLTIFIEKWLVLNRAEKDNDLLQLKIKQKLEEGDIGDAIAFADEHKTPLSEIIKSALVRSSKSKEEIETSLESTAKVEIAEVEKRVKILLLISQIAPLVGLLGTVLGFIDAFSEMRLSGMMDISTAKIGGAMEYALITTAAGLVVAIPAHIGYNYLVSRIEGLTLYLETQATEIVESLIAHLELNDKSFDRRSGYKP